GALDVAEADGADLALRLRHDDVGPQLAKQRLIDGVDRQRVLDDGTDLAVDLGAGGVDVDLGAGADGQTGDGRRVVTFVGAADEVISEAQLADDLRGAGDEGYDSRHSG